jgi:hypothetical protein
MGGRLATTGNPIEDHLTLPSDERAEFYRARHFAIINHPVDVPRRTAKQVGYGLYVN